MVVKRCSSLGIFGLPSLLLITEYWINEDSPPQNLLCLNYSLQNCTKCRKCLIFIAIAVLANLEPHGYKKMHLIGPLSFYLVTNHWYDGDRPPKNIPIPQFPLQKWSKTPKMLNFSHNRCFVKLQFWPSLSPNRIKEMRLIGHMWASQPSPCHWLLE